MNGRSGKNNVEIKSGQQVCVVFFISLALHFAMTGGKGRNRDEFLRQMNERRGGGVSRVSIFLKDKSKTLPMLTFAVFTFLQNGCPFPL